MPLSTVLIKNTHILLLKWFLRSEYAGRCISYIPRNESGNLPLVCLLAILSNVGDEECFDVGIGIYSQS